MINEQDLKQKLTVVESCLEDLDIDPIDFDSTYRTINALRYEMLNELDKSLAGASDQDKRELIQNYKTAYQTLGKTLFDTKGICYRRAKHIKQVIKTLRNRIQTLRNEVRTLENQLDCLTVYQDCLVSCEAELNKNLREVKVLLKVKYGKDFFDNNSNNEDES